jgi:hypothetical protein
VTTEAEWQALTHSEKNAALPSGPDPTFVVGGRSRTIALVPDIHAPYHSESLFSQALEICKSASFIIVMGDLLDAYSISSFDKDPRRKHTFKDEREMGRELLNRLRLANKWAEMHFIEGNHEDRLRRYLWKKAPELADMPELTIRSQLALDSMRIHYHPMSGFKKWGRRFKHGEVVRPRGGYSAHGEMLAHRASGFSVHTHRMGHATFTDKEGVFTEWWEGGHLCDTTHAEYTTTMDWNAGMLIAHLDQYNEIKRVERIDLVA